MPSIRFYHVGQSEPAAVDSTLARLLEIAVQRGQQALVVCPDDARAQRLDDTLWTYRDDSFLPHQRLEESDLSNIVSQPESSVTILAPQMVIIAACGYLQEDKNHPKSGQNGHKITPILAQNRLPIILSGAESALENFPDAERIFYMFSSASGAVATARTQWKMLKEKNISLEYWQEKDGKWQRQS